MKNKSNELRARLLRFKNALASWEEDKTIRSDSLKKSVMLYQAYLQTELLKLEHSLAHTPALTLVARNTIKTTLGNLLFRRLEHRKAKPSLNLSCRQ